MVNKVKESNIDDNSITTSKVEDSAITTAKINADAITEAKIADNAISEEHLDATVITGNTELSASAAGDDVLLVYDTSAGVIKKISASNVGLQAPTISSVSPTNLISGDGTGNYTITITGTNYTADVTAKLVKQGGSDLAFDTVTRNSSTQLTCVIAKSSILNADEPFDVVVTTAGALTATDTDAITVDASPAFVTSAGSLGTFIEGDSISVSVNATDPDSAGNVTFELQSGTLPAGLSLTNTAAEGGTAIISGTASAVVANTTSNFTLRAVDAASNTTSRSFSITVNNEPVSESFTSSGTFSVPSGVTAVDVLVVAGGGGGGSAEYACVASGGGGAGGLIFMPEYPVTPGGTVSVTVGCGGAGGGGSHCSGGNGQDSVFGTLTAKGGGGGASLGSGPLSNAAQNGIGNSGGSGGGGGTASTPNAGGAAIQPTQPDDSGAYGFGNNGGFAQPYGGTPKAAGGGGAGGAGSPYCAGPTSQGAGGAGKAYTIADGTTPVYYAGGGGGGGNPSGGQGGQGGGGDGGNYPAGSGQAGTANRGGGAGGNAVASGPNPLVGIAGGKGIVIVRY